MNDYSTILREHNLKSTPQRLAIIQVIEKYGHVNIDTLYEEIKNIYSSISLATIYKNINSMVENKLLLEVKLPNAKSVFEIIKMKHAHLKCDICGVVQDVEVDNTDLFEAVAKDNDFKIIHTDVILSGVCKNCT